MNFTLPLCQEADREPLNSCSKDHQLTHWKRRKAMCKIDLQAKTDQHRRAMSHPHTTSLQEALQIYVEAVA